MTTRHAPTATPRTTRVTSTADRVVATCQTQKTRRGNAGSSLQVGHVPHPSRQAQRKGVTVVRHHSRRRPLFVPSAPRVAPGAAA